VPLLPPHKSQVLAPFVSTTPGAVLGAVLFVVMGTPALAQQVRAEPPVGAIAPVGQGNAGNAAANAAAEDDPGVAVDVGENDNLARYLRKAQVFLGREDFDGAIQVLQQVIEGKMDVVVASGPEDDLPAPNPPPKPEPAAPATSAPQTTAARQVLRPGAGGQPAAGQPAPEAPPDARNSVFSQDGRLYRPVRRLCHELLSRMPSVGVEIYRAKHEVAAAELLEAAMRDGSVNALEEVANRYFVTLPAGRAMALLADRLMHEGRYRAAVLVFGDLLDTYPADNRKRLGISEVWCRFKIALCLRLAGEQGAAHDAVQAMATSFPADSLRVLGELHAVKDLPTEALFARDVAAIAPTGVAASPLAWLADPTSELVPLWQCRFRNSEPYKDPKASNNDRNIFFGEGVVSASMPWAGRYGPATWVAISDRHPQANGLPQALFLEHYRLRTADATSGLLLAQGDGQEEPPLARDTMPRVRVAASDFALLRPVDDGQRRYIVQGHPRAPSTTSNEALKTSTLIAYDAVPGANSSSPRVWSSEQWLDGEGGLRDVTFLAAPTIFGERLLLPALRGGRYSLECIERQTGRPAWNTRLHSGGSQFYKAPGCPVVVQSGVAFVATNAGCIAAVDAFTGTLRWIRRYERIDPRRKPVKTRRAARDDMGMRSQFAQDELPGFWPNDLILFEGLVIAAPCDSDMLLCLDGSTGQPHWMLDAAMTRYTPYGKLRTLLGISSGTLFATSDTHLVAIGASGGLVKWARELPVWNGAKNSGRGRGTVAGDHIVIPGERELSLYDTAGALLRRVALPAFDPSRDPLAGSINIVVDRAWLALGYQGGVEVFSGRAPLQQLAATATDVRTRADLLLRAGEADQAIAALVAAIAAGPELARKQSLANDLLSIARERAITILRGGNLAAALAVLDGVAASMTPGNVRLHWHLARVELCKDGGDLLAHEREQNRLYDYMEGKG
jgi:hypothetical protein